MDSLLDVTDEVLVDGLKTELGAEGQASYVMSRSMDVFNPTTSASYGPNSARVMTFNIAPEWLDAGTGVMLQFELHNKSDTLKLVPIGGPWQFFSRLRINVGGVTETEIPVDYARLYEQINMLHPPAVIAGQDITNGYARQNSTITLTTGPENSFVTLDVPKTLGRDLGKEIAPGQKVVCTMQIAPSALLSSGRLLPVKNLGGLEVTYEIQSDKYAPVVGRSDLIGAHERTSSDWEILNPQIHAQTVVIEASVNEKLNQQVANGEFRVSGSNYVIMSQSTSGVANGDFRLNFQRSLGRLKGMIVSQFKNPNDTGGQPLSTETLVRCMGAENASAAQTAAGYQLKDIQQSAALKRGNYFYVVSPGSANQWQVSVGSKLYPSQLTQSGAYSQQFKQLLQMVGIHAARDGVNIHYEEFNGVSNKALTNKFLSWGLFLDTEKYGGADLSGIETRNQVISVRGVGTGLENDSELFLTLHFDQDLVSTGAGSVRISE